MDLTNAFSMLGAGFAMGFGAIGAAIGEGIIAMKAVEALGRQPRSMGKLVRTMLVGQAVAETAGIFALVIALVLIFGVTKGHLAHAYACIAAGFAIGFGTIGSGIGAGLPGSAACEGIGRQPGNTEVITINMLLGQAVAQTTSIFALVVALVLIGVDPKPTLVHICALLGSGLAIGFGTLGAGFGEGIVARYANDAVGRAPRQLALITRTMLMGQAVTETTTICALVVSLILIFVV